MCICLCSPMENINTISVLIVDDEYLIRSLIRNSVRWEAYGMEVVGEAGDGESALSFIRTFQPQIALVDINMPILNGLELAQKVREGNYKTHIIFLTGYRDFEYAKQAVTYQAFDYLLKPIDADELAETLIRLSGQIAREQRLLDHVQKIEKQSDRGKRLLRERFLRRLVFGRMHMTQQQLTEQMRRLEISLEPRNLAGADRHRGRTFSLYARCRCEPPLPGLWPAGNGDAGGDGRAGREVLSFR